MNVLEIIRTYLDSKDYDGLCNTEFSCGCGIDDLAPGGEGCLSQTCVPAMKRKAIQADVDDDSGMDCEVGEELYFPIPEKEEP